MSDKISSSAIFSIQTLKQIELETIIEKPTETMSIQELWGIYFRYLTDKSKRHIINQIVANEEGIAMATEVLISISKDEVERARLMSEYKYQLDTQSKLVHAKREGIQEVIGLLKSGKSPEEIINDYEEKE